MELDDAVSRHLPAEVDGTSCRLIGGGERRLVGVFFLRVEIGFVCGRISLSIIPAGDREVDPGIPVVSCGE